MICMLRCIQCGNNFKRSFIEGLQDVRICSECRKENQSIKRRARLMEEGIIEARNQEQQRQESEEWRKNVRFRPWG